VTPIPWLSHGVAVLRRGRQRDAPGGGLPGLDGAPGGVCWWTPGAAADGAGRKGAMDRTTISGDAQAVARGAGEALRAATDHSFGDARNGLRYMLLRLSVVGLSAGERGQLTELARLAFQESDVAAQAGRIRDAADASPLAVAIADLVQETGRTSKRATMLGAISGAYAALRSAGGQHDELVLKGLLAAVAGATAAATAEFLDGERTRDSWRSFLEKE
jgi:hypothetical protein